jgi:hypothetical protein
MNYLITNIGKSTSSWIVKHLKMLYLALIIIPTCLGSSLMAAETNKFIAGDNSIGTKLCIHAAENNLKAYKRTIKILVTNSSSATNRKVSNAITCNNMSIVSFARKFGADLTTKHMHRYLINKKGTVVIKDLALKNSIENSNKIIVITAS